MVDKGVNEKNEKRQLNDRKRKTSQLSQQQKLKTTNCQTKNKSIISTTNKQKKNVGNAAKASLDLEKMLLEGPTQAEIVKDFILCFRNII